MKMILEIKVEKIKKPMPWKYQAIMKVFGIKRFLIFGDTAKEARKEGVRRLRELIF